MPSASKSAEPTADLFEVHDGTLWMAGYEEPKTRSEAFYFGSDWDASPQKLLAAMEDCPPLAWHVYGVYFDRREAMGEAIDREASSSEADEGRLRRLRQSLEAMPEEPEEGVPDWLAGLDTETFADVVKGVEKWLSEAPSSGSGWGSDERDHFAVPADGQAAALDYFREQSDEVLDELQVEIVEGEHPGSSYCAAELMIDVDEANRIAAHEGIPIRFVVTSTE